MIRGLTLRMPWSWAICHAGKRIENRTWRPNPWKVRDGLWLAIHCGKSVDGDMEPEVVQRAQAYRRSAGLEPFPKMTRRMLRADAGKIVAVARVAGTVTASLDPWFVGPLGWVLENVVVLAEPVARTGALGLWKLDPKVLSAVIGQLPEATRLDIIRS